MPVRELPVQELVALDVPLLRANLLAIWYVLAFALGKAALQIVLLDVSVPALEVVAED